MKQITKFIFTLTYILTAAEINSTQNEQELCVHKEDLPRGQLEPRRSIEQISHVEYPDCNFDFFPNAFDNSLLMNIRRLQRELARRSIILSSLSFSTLEEPTKK